MEAEEEPDMVLDRLAANAKKTPDKMAVSYMGSSSSSSSSSTSALSVERSLTYRELEDVTDGLARRLLMPENNYKLSPKDVVVLVYPPSLDFAICFLACLKAGLVPVPVFPPNPSKRDTLVMFSSIVQHSQAKVALTSAKYNHIKQLSNIQDSLKRIIPKGGRSPPAWPQNLKWIVTDSSSSSSSKPSSDVSSFPTISRSDVAFLQFTSGSTSEPKGVMITHGNLAHNLKIITNELKASDDTVVCSWLPQYHDMGLIGSYLGLLYCGGSGYYMSPLTYLQRPMVWIETISKYQATHLQAPNFSFSLTARKFEPSNYSIQGAADGDDKTKSNKPILDMSSVRHMINAAEPVTEKSMDAFLQAFEPFGLKRETMVPTYGLAEHTVFVASGGTQRLWVHKGDLEIDRVVTIVDESSPDTSRLIGCGYPSHQNVDVQIVDTDSMQPVEEDVVGEIWVNSPSKAAGYYGKPEETKHDFQAQLAGTDGGEDNESSSPTQYLRTGDLGFLHKKELFICGRLKDLIIVGGRNYYPQDLEATAESCAAEHLRPGCSAAFSVNDDADSGEAVTLVMELKTVPPSKETKSVCSSIVETVRSAVSKEHALRLTHIILVRPRTIPKTTSGKIARAWTRKAFLKGTLNVVYKQTSQESFHVGRVESSSNAPPSAPRKKMDAAKIRSLDNATLLKKLVKDVSRVGSVPVESIDKDAPLTTILDSMSLSQFKGMLEGEYATRLSDEYLFREATTLNKLVEVVKLGYAPDDDGQPAGPGAASTVAHSPGQAGGLAGALGCPPGVVCCVVM